MLTTVSLHNASGTCQCGDIRYAIDGEVEAFVCHCHDCRANSAAPCTAWGKVHNDGFELRRGELKHFNTSAGVTWFFCKTCGTSIKYSSDESFPFIDFTLGTLHAAADISPAYHVQIQEKLPWLVIADGLPAYDRWRPDDSSPGDE